MQHHRLGFPPVQHAVDTILEPEDCPAARRLTRDWRAYQVERESKRFRTMPAGHSPANDDAATAKWERDHPIAAPIARLPDKPYQPEGFSFQYVDRKGKPGAVIPKRSADPFVRSINDFSTQANHAGERLYDGATYVNGSSITISVTGGCGGGGGTFSGGASGGGAVLSGLSQKDVPEGATHRYHYSHFYFRPGPNGIRQAFVDGCWKESTILLGNETLDDPARGFIRITQPAAPTEWQSGPPPEIGFYIASRYREDDVVRFWNGYVWSLRVMGDRPASSCIDMFDRSKLFGVEWRGPRLVGEAWPEPEAPAAEKVPSADECRRAYVRTLGMPKDANGNDAADRLLFEMAGEMNCDSIPANRRAEFIRRLREL